MQDGIELLGKKIVVDEIEYKVSNFNFMPHHNTFHVELESKKNGFINISLQKFTNIFAEQIEKYGIKHINNNKNLKS